MTKKKCPIGFSFYKCNLRLLISTIVYIICVCVIFLEVFMASFVKDVKIIKNIFKISGNITGIINGKLNGTQDIVIKLNESIDFNGYETKITGDLEGKGCLNETESYNIKSASINAIIFNNNFTTELFGLISFLNNNTGFMGKIIKEYNESYNNENDNILLFKGEKYNLEDDTSYTFSFAANRIIYNIIANFGQILTIFFKFFQFKSNKKKVKDNENSDLENNDEDSLSIVNNSYRFIYNDHSDILKLSKMDIILLLILLIFSIPLPFAEYYLSIYTFVPLYESFFAYLLIIFAIIYIQKEKLYKHQKLSIFLTILIGIPELINNIFILNDDGGDDTYFYEDEGGTSSENQTDIETNESESYEDDDYYGYGEEYEFNQSNVFEYSIYTDETFEPIDSFTDDENKVKKNFLILISKIYLAVHFIFSILFKSRLMEHYFFSPLKVCYLFGFFNFIIYLLLLIINSAKSGTLFQLEQNGNTLDTYDVFVNSFKEHYLYIILLIIFSTLNNLVIIYIVKFFKLFEGLFLYTINDILIMLYYNSNSQIRYIFSKVELYLIFIPKYILMLMYLEVIRLKFLDLDKDAKETIEERAILEMEMIKIQLDNDSDDDDVEEDEREERNSDEFISESSKTYEK